MLNRPFILTLGLMALTSASALAGGGPIHQADADGDGAPVALSDQNGDGNVDHKDIGVAKSAYDCDDANPFRSPALPEKDDDGIDNDCDVKTPDAQPEDEPTRARFAANEYSGATWDRQRFVVEHGRMTKGATATPPTAKVNTGAGTFEVLDSDDYLFVDIYLGDTKVIGTDGHRELVPNDDAAQNAINEIADREAKKATEAKPVYRGPSKATRQAEATEAAEAVVEGEAEARMEADVEHDRRLDDIESGNDDRDGFISDLIVADDSLFAADDVLTDAVVDEAEAREEADRLEAEAREQADDAEREAREEADRELQRRQDAQASTVTELSTSGFAINGGVIGGVQLQRELTASGDTLRGPAMGGVGMDLTVHLDLDDALIGGFGSATWGSDGSGSGADEAYLLGFEALGDINDSGHHLGGFAAYRHTGGHSNLLDVSVPADGACGGASYRYQAPSAGHVTVSPFARIGVCGEVYGSKGWQDGADGDLNLVVTRGQGIGATALVGVSFSATSVLDR